jgi:oligopeptidase B
VYGAYGNSRRPLFDADRVSLLDRGVTVAIAHVRGGSELGMRWYFAGKLQHKRNSFTDFVAVEKHLLERRYTSHDALAIYGMSAGGMLVGAALNLAPSLPKVAVLDVPAVDLLNSMSDASIPLTTLEYEEWGDPRVRADYEYMRAYSPYDNIDPAARYPFMLVKASYNDSQVMYWEPAKWVAQHRYNDERAGRQDHGLLLKTNMTAGHAGSSGRAGRVRDRAFDYAVVLTQIGAR